MKKFGTPIGAAPGSAKEKVGFDGVGTPAPVGLVEVVGAGLDLGLLVLGLVELDGAVVGPWCELGC